MIRKCKNLKSKHKNRKSTYFLSLFNPKTYKLYSYISILVILIAIPITVVSSLYKTNILNFAAGGNYYISGSIWLDTGEGYPPDGKWNNNEVASTFTGSPNITLHGPNGQTWQTTPTSGGYSFHNLPAGTYTITTTGFTPTNQSELTNFQLNGNLDPFNIGYYAGSSNGGSYYISGSIWLDTKDPGSKPDGIYNNGEVSSTFTGNPQIQLKDNDTGQTWQTTPTSGGYSFHNLKTGTYSITVSSFTPTNQGQLTNFKVNGNLDPFNIGYYTGNSSGTSGNLKIAGSIWIDSNGNGQWDNSEQPENNGVSGSVIELENSATRPIAQTTTTGAGYGFTNLAAGLYYIKVYGFTPTNQSQLQKIINLSSNINDINIGYNPNNTINNNGTNPSPSPVGGGNNNGGSNNGGSNNGGQNGGNTGGKNVVCSSASNPQCSFSSSCSTEGQTCQCADPGWANHDKVFQCTSGSWKYKTDSTNFTCTERCQ